MIYNEKYIGEVDNSDITLIPIIGIYKIPFILNF